MLTASGSVVCMLPSVKRRVAVLFQLFDRQLRGDLFQHLEWGGLVEAEPGLREAPDVASFG